MCDFFRRWGLGREREIHLKSRSLTGMGRPPQATVGLLDDPGGAWQAEA